MDFKFLKFELSFYWKKKKKEIVVMIAFTANIAKTEDYKTVKEFPTPGMT